MPPLLLACLSGSIASEHSAVVVPVILLLCKPVAYFVLAWSFRFRVARPLPLSFRQAAHLAGARFLLGPILFAIIACCIFMLGAIDPALWLHRVIARTHGSVSRALRTLEPTERRIRGHERGIALELVQGRDGSQHGT
jgi:hypothetical protein